MISTDKAIEPVSMLGLTKRFAEMYCQALDHDLAVQYGGKPHMRLISVRFGNVLASNGSVVPKFKAQIEAGGPVTVTHPDMVRYFMTIREACDLVLTAATHALTPARPDVSVYVLKMGQPVKIVELAERMIRLSGLQPGNDIDIVFSGMRPGERLNEILFASEEPTVEIGIAGIMAAKPNEPPMATLRKWLAALEAGDRQGRPHHHPRRAEGCGARIRIERCLIHPARDPSNFRESHRCRGLEKSSSSASIIRRTRARRPRLWPRSQPTSRRMPRWWCFRGGQARRRRHQSIGRRWSKSETGCRKRPHCSSARPPRCCSPREPSSPLLRRLKPCDVALTVTAPFMLPHGVAAAARLKGARSILILHDLFPDVLVMTGLLKPTSLVARAIRTINTLLFRALTAIVVIGRDSEKLLLRYRGMTPEKIEFIPNWATLVPAIRPIRADNRFRRALAARFIVGLSGNLGFTHDPLIVFEAARRLKDDESIHFLLSGWGIGFDQLKAMQSEAKLANVTLIDRVADGELEAFLAAADVWLIPYRKNVAGVSVPSRFYNLLAVGRPVILVSEPEAEAALTVSEHNLGWVVTPGMPDQLADAIRSASRLQDPKMSERAIAVAGNYSPARALTGYTVLIQRLLGDAFSKRTS